MSNQIVSVDSNMGATVLSLAVRHGKFRTPRNRDLPRPRAVREATMSTCISQGCGDGGNGGKGMAFSAKRPEEVYGVRK